jgi:phosphate transport system protein
MPHTVKAYDDELKRLSGDILRMGGLAETQLVSAISALAKRDRTLADAVIAGDKEIDKIENDVENLATRLLALRQPVASDLRLIVGSIKLAAEIERVGDYAKNIAKRSHALGAVDPVRPASAVPRMGALVSRMIKDALDAFARRDAQRAYDVWRRDAEIDEMYNSIFRELLTYMMEDPRSITPCTHLLFVAKNLERMGDHATNMAEMIYYIVEGARLDDARPKSDDTPMLATPPVRPTESA